MAMKAEKAMNDGKIDGKIDKKSSINLEYKSHNPHSCYNPKHTHKQSTDHLIDECRDRQCGRAMKDESMPSMSV